MFTSLNHPWVLFCIAFGIMLLATYIMNRQGRHFFTMDPVKRAFAILDLEFPPKCGEITNILKGMFRLPAKESILAVRSLKHQLLTDTLLFMPATYGGIFILCYTLGQHMGHVGYWWFTILAWAQLLCFLLDFIENTYFWKHIRPDAPDQTDSAFKNMKVLQGFKWGISLTGAVCGFAGLAYHWLSGRYGDYAPWYVAVFFLEILIYLYFNGKLGKAETESASGA